ncbi:MAG TPA: biotin/lipoyl-containing protein [Candidatus Dormibacteraeota bacterium]|nr:biotin/lipoyl-containing protein [Candidatus Dormibacteraeota bacterium]
MKTSLKINGRVRSIEIDLSATQLRFRIDGRDVAADILVIQPGIYSILMGGEAFEARIESGPYESHVYIGGREYSVEVLDLRRWQRGRNEVAAADGHQQIIAPMPGKVVRVMVHVGDAVAVGQGILVVEAMKMQNEIKSPGAGTVEHITASEGQAVNAGDILAVIV